MRRKEEWLQWLKDAIQDEIKDSKGRIAAGARITRYALVDFRGLYLYTTYHI